MGWTSDAGKPNAAAPKRPSDKTPAATDFKNMTSTFSRQGLEKLTAQADLTAFARLTGIWMQQVACFFTEFLRSFSLCDCSPVRRFLVKKWRMKRIKNHGPTLDRSNSILRWSNQMDCQQVEQLLSHYFDNELCRDDRAEVEIHLENCSPCSDQLADIHMLSEAARSLSSARPPHDLWDRIAAQLKESQLPDLVNDKATKLLKSKAWSDQTHSLRWFAVAAVLLIAVGLLWTLKWSSHQHDPFVTYAQMLDSSPVAAQKTLVSKYSGQTVSVDEAVQLVGYRPRNVDPPPSGYSCDQLVVLDMPCCKCVQAVWQRQDQTQVAIFEHKSKMDDWFQDKPSVNIMCRDKVCRVTQLNGQLAATWQIGERVMTVIGLRDVEELLVLFGALS